MPLETEARKSGIALPEQKSFVVHPFEPVWTPQSTVLILGTLPSVASREKQFYYGHPRNRFWKLLAVLYNEQLPQTTDDKQALLLKYNIAVWDVLSECSITGSADNTIREPVPNDIAGRICRSAIKKILLNGKKSYELYVKYCADKITLPAICLPSTSPANASWGLPRLLEAWGCEMLNNK